MLGRRGSTDLHVILECSKIYKLVDSLCFKHASKLPIHLRVLFNVQQEQSTEDWTGWIFENHGGDSAGTVVFSMTLYQELPCPDLQPQGPIMRRPHLT